ncbi:MAG: DUF1926 domain-containing protein [Planctomycetia bacterium]|nr:DUF1926 domain-containing protein [Planctomycetia bacterium]
MALNPVRFALAFHNHQPVGNFEGTIEDAYQQSYLPFLELFSRPEYASLKISLHNSGCLEEWLEKHHPEYLDRLRELAMAGRVEILGGPFQEPILAMLPSRDRIGQIRYHRDWLAERLGVKVRGMWMPERVWEPDFVSDLAEAGIEYTIVDDYHFKKAGLREEQLFGHFTSENDGRLVSIFPGSEKLRYWIPFHSPEETVNYFREIREIQKDPVIVFGDDGEKFGTWPQTYKHVYEDGWLVSFFDTLVEHSGWIRTVTLGEAYDAVEPLGKLYLPDCSYREMTEWSLPCERLVEYEKATRAMPQDDPLWQVLKTFLSGGNWRNFKVKYPETNEMYARMMAVSTRLARMEADPKYAGKLDNARLELYRGQCNCGYWHGAFGGCYLPHLRNGIYRHLIAADNLLDRLENRIDSVGKADYNFDAFEEYRLSNAQSIAWLAPRRGGMLYEFDLREKELNLLATLARRPEAYHEKVRLGNQQKDDDCASIHERVHFKQDGLETMLQYDTRLQKSLQDRFLSRDGKTCDDWSDKKYDAVLEGGSLILSCTAPAMDENGVFHEITLRKAFSLRDGGGFQVVYRLENLPPDAVFRFASEYHFAALPGHCDDRYFYDATGEKRGDLSTKLELLEADTLGLVDEWLNLDVKLGFSQKAILRTCPIETVSNSEGGFEAVHQSVSVLPVWWVKGDWECVVTVEIV